MTYKEAWKKLKEQISKEYSVRVINNIDKEKMEAFKAVLKEMQIYEDNLIEE